MVSERIRKPWNLFTVAQETKRIHGIAESSAPGLVTRREIANKILLMNTGLNPDMIPLFTERYINSLISTRQPNPDA